MQKKEITHLPFGLFNIELTNKCPMKCVMCPRTNNMTREQGFMEFGLFKKVVDELVLENPNYVDQSPVWLHHFGESLLHPECTQFIRYIKEKGVKAFLSINPIMLTGQLLTDLLLAQPDLLYLSLDGHDDESFYQIRGLRNAYKKSHQNVLNFLAYKKELKSRVKIVLSMIDFPMNAESILKTESYWRAQEGIDNVLIKTFSTWDGNAHDIKLLRQKSDEDLNQHNQKNGKVQCTMPWEMMTVLWDGYVVPCCYDYDKRLILGNAYQAPLTEIWNDTRMRALRSEFINNQVDNLLCRKCEKLYLPRHLWNW